MRELEIAATERLKFDFDRAAAIMSCFADRSIGSPAALNPYRKHERKPKGITVEEIEREYRVAEKNGKVIRDTITVSQVISQ